MRLTDFFKTPVIVDINGGPDPDRPYRASCPRGDWQSDRWVATARTAREQQTQHYAREHYGFAPHAWGAGGFDADSWGSGWGSGWE